MQHGAGEVFDILVTPKLQLIDNILKSWQPEKRGCFLEHEKDLKYFRIYTKVNCEHECLSEATLKTCGCVPFYMISKPKVVSVIKMIFCQIFGGLPSDKICGVLDRKCYSMQEIKFNFSGCNCLDRCDHLSYSLLILHGHNLLVPCS